MAKSRSKSALFRSVMKDANPVLSPRSNTETLVYMADYRAPSHTNKAQADRIEGKLAKLRTDITIKTRQHKKKTRILSLLQANRYPNTRQVSEMQDVREDINTLAKQIETKKRLIQHLTHERARLMGYDINSYTGYAKPEPKLKKEIPEKENPRHLGDTLRYVVTKDKTFPIRD